MRVSRLSPQASCLQWETFGLVGAGSGDPRTTYLVRGLIWYGVGSLAHNEPAGYAGPAAQVVGPGVITTMQAARASVPNVVKVQSRQGGRRF